MLIVVCKLYLLGMSVKLFVTLMMAIIAIALIVAIVIVAARTAKGDGTQFIKDAMAVVKAIATALAIVIGAGVAGISMTGCAARRSITVQGTVITQAGGDSTRVIISSQESYTGRKNY